MTTLSLAELANPPKGRSSIYYTWCERILHGVFTKAQCNQWAQAVVPISQNAPQNGKRTNLTTEEALDLVDRLRAKAGVSLTPEHSDSGIAYLRKYGADIGIPQEAIDKFGGFAYQGETHVVENGRYDRHVPVWRFWTLDDKEFAYFVVPWQSGGYSGWWNIR